MAGQAQFFTRFPQIGPLKTKRDERQDMAPPKRLC
jgi:hypothetical protein